MAVAVTTLRSTLAAALENAGVWQVFSFPPATPIANSVIIQWDDPMLEVSNSRYNVAPKANFRIVMIVPMLDNSGNLEAIEKMIVGVFNKISASSLAIDVKSLTAPAVLAVEAGQMLSCEMAISIMTSWDQ